MFGLGWLENGLKIKIHHTKQKEVVILESSTILPLIALLINILEVITSPHKIKRCATFSANHSSGEPVKSNVFCYTFIIYGR